MVSAGREDEGGGHGELDYLGDQATTESRRLEVNGPASIGRVAAGQYS
jgi:hypothetical protein